MSIHCLCELAYFVVCPLCQTQKPIIWYFDCHLFCITYIRTVAVTFILWISSGWQLYADGASVKNELPIKHLPTIDPSAIDWTAFTDSRLINSFLLVFFRYFFSSVHAMDQTGFVLVFECRLNIFLVRKWSAGAWFPEFSQVHQYRYMSNLLYGTTRFWFR